MKNRANKPNRGFRRSFRAGIIIILILSLLISWATVSIIHKCSKPKENKPGEQTEMKRQDTIYIEKIKEVKVRDTIYIRPTPPKSKTVETVVPPRDTASK